MISFDNVIYKQIDGVSMGSTLDLLLANVIMTKEIATLYRISKAKILYEICQWNAIVS